MVRVLEIKGEDNLKLGDLIELPRLKGLFAHWAVYVGKGYVIHLSPPPSKSSTFEFCSSLAATSGISSITSGTVIDGALFGSIKVRRDKLKDVAHGSTIIVNNECDDEMRSYPGAEIVKRAKSKLGTNHYNIFIWNCEHFATWCRYGKAVSKQVPFSKALSIDAYIVRLPGVVVVPHGTLPYDVISRESTDENIAAIVAARAIVDAAGMLVPFGPLLQWFK